MWALNTRGEPTEPSRLPAPGCLFHRSFSGMHTVRCARRCCPGRATCTRYELRVTTRAHAKATNRHPDQLRHPTWSSLHAFSTWWAGATTEDGAPTGMPPLCSHAHLVEGGALLVPDAVVAKHVVVHHVVLGQAHTVVHTPCPAPTPETKRALLSKGRATFSLLDRLQFSQPKSGSIPALCAGEPTL